MDHNKYASKCASKVVKKADGGEITEKAPTPPAPEVKKSFLDRFLPTPKSAREDAPPPKKPGFAAAERVDAVKKRSIDTLKSLGED